LNKWTSPFLFVFLPPISKISLFEIAKALHAQSGFFILTVSINDTIEMYEVEKN
jgi:hypothetical protein